MDRTGEKDWDKKTEFFGVGGWEWGSGKQPGHRPFPALTRWQARRPALHKALRSEPRMTPLDATIENRDDFQNAERNSVHAVNSVKSPPAENECLFFTDLPPVPQIDPTGMIVRLRRQSTIYNPSSPLTATPVRPSEKCFLNRKSNAP